MYPEPTTSDRTVTVGDTTFQAGDQFRYLRGLHPITGEPTWGLCYVLDVNVDTDRVTLFNVSEEATVTHSGMELFDALDIGELSKLDEKWTSRNPDRRG